MPRSSRSKSHKPSKHSSKDVREHSDSEEDVKMKERNGKEEGSSRVSRDLESGEKRKVSSQSRDVKDPSGHGNGDASEEHVSSKRRKEKADGGSDRWNSGGNERGDSVTVDNKEIKGESSRIDVDKSSKSKESKGLVDSKSKSSRRHDGGSERKEVNVGSAVEKEESKSGIRVDSKRKSEKDSSGRRETHHHQVKDVKESKEKDRGSDREKKVQDVKRDTDGELTRKQGSKSVDLIEDQQHKRGRENTDWPIQDELRNPELEKELEKRIRRRGDGSVDKDKYQDDLKESEDRRLSSRGDHAKEGKYKDSRHKDESHGDKYREESDKEIRLREDKYRDDDEKERKHRDVKYREDGERESRHRDDRYRDDSDKDNRHRDDRENRRKADKYREDADRGSRRRDDKYREDGDNDDRYRDEKYREDGHRDSRHKGEKYREDVERESSRHRDGKQGDDIDREKRARDSKYRDRDRHSSRDRVTESDTKRLRDEGNAGDIHYRKTSVRDGSPVYDDRVTRYKDDNGRRRAGDKEDHNDVRSRRTNEQHSDLEKRSISGAKAELVTDRGRSITRNADSDITLNHGHRRSSPSSSSHPARDHYRNSKQEESKYRDYNYEERIRHHITSSREFTGTGLTERNSSRSLEKSIQKVDSHIGEASVDKRLRSDARGSPLQLVDKSPSSTSNDRRHFSRSDARRSLDVEDSGQRGGGFKDSKDYTSKEGKGSREMPMDTLPGDELSQADADSSFVSSPFTRASHFSASSRSLLPPPPPFRSSVESSLAFGSSEDDNRGNKSNNNRHRRIGDPNMGRNQGNSWKGVPTWPSPVPNGFMPFQHGPPPVGFHPVMQQFPAPPLFGARPSMELNHAVPYHIPDNDRFSGHGRWRNPVDDSCPPLWEANNVFGDESHLYGRLEWDHNRSQMSSRGWEASADMWKGQNSRGSADVAPPVPLKEDSSARGPADEGFVGQSDQHSPNEQNQLELPVETTNVSQSSEVLKAARELPVSTPEESCDISKVSVKDDAYFCHVYLSKIDISADLAQPELYEKCMNLMDIDKDIVPDEEEYPKILYLEEVGEAKANVPGKTSSASLFAAISDSVYQKAISLYKKQREEINAMNKEQVSFLNAVNPTPIQNLGIENVGTDDDKVREEEAPSCNQEEPVSTISNYSPEKTDPPTVCPKLEPVVERENLADEPIPTLNEVKMEVDLVEEAAVGTLVDVKPSTEAHLTSVGEEVNGSFNTGGDNNESPKNKCGGGVGGGELKFSDVSTTEGCEAVMMMAESIESGSVNLSRIHHSPESTH